MNLTDLLTKSALFIGIFAFSLLDLQGQNEDHEWRKWLSQDGQVEIEAYLKEVSPDGVVIVRRDGKEYTVSLDRFSEADRRYVQEWQQQKGSSGSSSGDDFSSIDFRTASAPEKHEISGVEQVRLGSGEAAETGAIKTILKFYDIEWDSNLNSRVSARKENRDVAIPPTDLTAVLDPFPVEMKAFVLPPPEVREMRRTTDRSIFNAIRKALSLDLPVLIAYRPEVDYGTPEIVAVATRYDRRTLYAIEAEGSRKPLPLDWRRLEDTLLQAVIIYPLPSAVESESETSKRQPSREFLRKISSVIQNSSGQNAITLTERFQDQELQASVQDVNRSDLQTQLGSTRSFAREGGIPQIEALLDRGSVAVIPQEFDSGNGFALIFGKNQNGFAAVEFFSNGKFSRGTVSEAYLARRWMTRDDRTYHLDLIDLPIPENGKSENN